MTVNKEKAYLECMNQLRTSNKWKSIDFSQKIRIIKSLSLIYQQIPEDQLSLFNAELILGEVSDRGDRTRSIDRLTEKLVDFQKQLEKEVIFRDKEKLKEKIFRTAAGIDLD